MLALDLNRKLAVLVVGAVATDAYIQTLGAIIVVNVALLTHVKFMPCAFEDLSQCCACHHHSHH